MEFNVMKGILEQDKTETQTWGSCDPEIGFWEQVQHRLPFCLQHMICVKMAVPSTVSGRTFSASGQ
jgi:hypothetical protein